MRMWQIGIASITSDDINWLHEFVEAETRDEAETKAIIKGYYRNVRIFERLNVRIRESE